MNKNVLRAFKRELINLYEAFDGSSVIGSFREKVRDFCEHLLMTSHYDSYQNKNFKRNNFYNFVGILLNYCRMKKLVRTPEEKEQLKICYEVIYSYSHQKFYEFMKVPEVTALMVILFRMVKVDRFVQNHPALAAHEVNYISHVKRLCSVISSKINK